MNKDLDTRLLELGKTILANLEIIRWEKIEPQNINNAKNILRYTIAAFMAKNGDVYDAPEFDIEVGRVENCIKLIPKNNLARRIGMLLCGEEEIELDYSNQGEQNNV